MECSTMKVPTIIIAGNLKSVNDTIFINFRDQRLQ